MRCSLNREGLVLCSDLNRRFVLKKDSDNIYIASDLTFVVHLNANCRSTMAPTARPLQPGGPLGNRIVPQEWDNIISANTGQAFTFDDFIRVMRFRMDQEEGQNAVEYLRGVMHLIERQQEQNRNLRKVNERQAAEFKQKYKTLKEQDHIKGVALAVVIPALTLCGGALGLWVLSKLLRRKDKETESKKDKRRKWIEGV